MAASGNINLFKKNVSLTPTPGAVEPQLRVIASAAMALVILGGVFVGITYLFLLQRHASLEGSRKRLMSQLTGESAKENLLVALKERVKIVEKLLATQRALVKPYDTVLSIAAPPILVTVSYDDQNRLVMLLRTGSIDEAVGIASKVITLAQEQQLKNPQLLSLVMEKDGIVRFAITFFPVL